MIHPDQQLLENFIATRCEQSFGELVRRYINLVYSAARRQSIDASAAEEITQLVFIKLAQRARTIRRQEAISGWLLVTTRYVALNHRRCESRRRHHEQEAAAMRAEVQNSPTVDAQIMPRIDDAMSRLRRADRDAITLKYFENRSLGEVGAHLGISEQAARKRIDRAIVKLRDILARQGVRTSAQSLTSALAVATLADVPGHLWAQIVSGALSSVPIATGSGLGILKGVSILMAMSKAKLALVSMVVVVGLVPVTYMAYQNKATSAANSIESVAPTVVKMNDWKADFHRLYALAPGESVRLVEPPFYDVRSAFVSDMKMDEAFGYPETMVIEFDGQNFAWKQASPLVRDVGDTLRYVAGIWPQDTDLSRKLIATPVPGDWVIREGTPESELIASMSRMLSTIAGKPVALVREPMQRDVIVVRGAFQYDPQTEFARQQTIPTIQVSRDAPRDEQGYFTMIAQEQNEMLQILGEMLGHPVINESQFAKVTPYMISLQGDSDFRRAPQAPGGGSLDQMLETLSRQTGLKFTVEKRNVPTWRMR